MSRNESACETVPNNISARLDLPIKKLLKQATIRGTPMRKMTSTKRGSYAASKQTSFAEPSFSQTAKAVKTNAVNLNELFRRGNLMVNERNSLGFRGAAVGNTQQYHSYRIGYMKPEHDLDLEIQTDPAKLMEE